jgi:deazaflavin-dependent oxidoreductase (nitroreductase family)
MDQYKRMEGRVPRGLWAGTAAAITLAWGLYFLNPHAWPGLGGTVTHTALYGGNLYLTARHRAVKIALVRGLQRHVVNPVLRAGLSIGLNPLGLALLETRGRTTGLPRRTPVGNGRMGDEFWVIAEHGHRAGYVRNLVRDPRVRVRMRTGLRYRWYDGLAEVRPDDDPLARQRAVIAWHPLRALNAMNVRVLGADLLVVRIRLLGVSSRNDAGEAPMVSVRSG